MSGKYQHYIWKHIQNGFSTISDLNPKHNNIYKYTKEGGAKLGITANTGAKNRYYGEVDSDTDSVITDKEKQLAKFIGECRYAQDGDILDTEKAASFITLCEIRGVHARKVFMESGELVASMIRTEIESDKFLISIAEFKINKIKDKLNMNNSLFLLDHIIDYLLKYRNKITNDIFNVLNDFEINSKHKAENVHNENILEQIINNERHISNLEYVFRAKRRKIIPFILPDSGVCFVSAKTPFPISNQFYKYRGVLAPISSDVCIVGTPKDKKLYRFSLSEKDILYNLASVSKDMFIAKEKLKIYDENSKFIGKNSKPILDDEYKSYLIRLFYSHNVMESIQEDIKIPYKGMLL